MQMASDSGINDLETHIREILPRLDNETMAALLIHLNKLGVSCLEDFNFVKAESLMPILKEVEARKLLQPYRGRLKLGIESLLSLGTMSVKEYVDKRRELYARGCRLKHQLGLRSTELDNASGRSIAASQQYSWFTFRLLTNRQHVGALKPSEWKTPMTFVAFLGAVICCYHYGAKCVGWVITDNIPHFEEPDYGEVNIAGLFARDFVDMCTSNTTLW